MADSSPVVQREQVVPPCADVVGRTAEALRDASADVGSILGDVGAALRAGAVCVLRRRSGRVFADGARPADIGWRHETAVLGDMDLDAIPPHQAVARGVAMLSLPADGWRCARSATGALVLGVRGAALNVSAAVVVATMVELVLMREMASAASHLTALVQERARIASVVHESVSQELATISLQLEVLAQLVGDTPQVKELADLARATTRRSIASVREAILDLSPIAPPSASFTKGMRQLVDEFADRWAVDLSFDVDGIPRDIDPDVAGLAYAFVQEVLTNVRKHSRAYRGAVHVAFDADGITVAVTSAGDAVGVRARTKPGEGGRRKGESTGQGMALMRGRARLFGGDVVETVESDGGREVTLHIPS